MAASGIYEDVWLAEVVKGSMLRSRLITFLLLLGRKAAPRRRLLAVVAVTTVVAPASGAHSLEMCTFDGRIYGFLYTAPNWNAPRLADIPKFACFAGGNAAQMFYDQKLVFGPRLGTVEVLRDIVRLEHIFHRGDTFQTSNDLGEGSCTLKFRKEQAELTPSDLSPPEAASMDCVWLPGFSNHEPGVFRIITPYGPQHWFHLVAKDHRPLGWYLTDSPLARGDPDLLPLAR